MALEKERRCLIIEHNGILKITLIDSTRLKHADLGEGRLDKNQHGDHSTDIFGPVEENSDDSVEEEEEEEDEPEEEQEKDDISSIFEEKGEVENVNQTIRYPWRPLRQKLGQDLKELYWNEVQQFPDRGKSQTYAENAAFNALLPLWRGRLRRTNLERLKWIHRIKLDTVHRKVMKTLRRLSTKTTWSLTKQRSRQ